jgi:hypothetical protein
MLEFEKKLEYRFKHGKVSLQTFPESKLILPAQKIALGKSNRVTIGEKNWGKPYSLPSKIKSTEGTST